ncbi:sensory box histidine kinase [gamma proteobacterium NOR5-3]|nr:sensory box histidine kinase [gamma proteobacterium NOR5-3]
MNPTLGNVGSSVSKILLEGEQWLMERVLHYAKQQSYTPYTSTLICAWQLSVAGLSAALVETLEGAENPVIEFTANERYADNSIADFAVEEALKHRERGVNLGMFLGLFKYYRQAYLDLVEQQVEPHHDRAEARHIIHRCFDLFEIALVTRWNASPLDAVIDELSKANREITNEKNFYLTAYESLIDPAFLIDEELRLINLNGAAMSMLSGTLTASGELYYRARVASNLLKHGESAAQNDRASEVNALLGSLITDHLPALKD